MEQADPVDLDARATLDADSTAVFAALADLATYPHWLGIVASATPTASHADDAWSVELIGRVGPFNKKKRVRMARIAHDPDAGSVRFERRELDGRTHNDWVLTGAATTATSGRVEVHVHLHYGGGRQLPGADLLLRQEVRKAGSRLQAFLDRTA